MKSGDILPILNYKRKKKKKKSSFRVRPKVRKAKRVLPDPEKHEKWRGRQERVTLILLAKFWNESFWMDSCFEYMDYWKADRICIAEGGFNRDFPARSEDDTIEKIKLYASKHPNVTTIDVIRNNPVYKKNLIDTNNVLLKLSKAKPGDYVVMVDCDHYFHKSTIDMVKKDILNDMDYFVHKCYAFGNSIDKAVISNETCGKLPVRIRSKTKFIGGCTFGLDGINYNKSKYTVPYEADYSGYHYPVLGKQDARLNVKYSKPSTPDKNWFEKMKLEDFNGDHPEFVKEMLCLKS